MRLAEKIARWLSPDLANRADRYWYLSLQVEDVRTWCDGEARVVGQWLLDKNRDHWRALGEPPVGKMPDNISQFREWLYRQRDLQNSASQ